MKTGSQGASGGAAVKLADWLRARMPASARRGIRLLTDPLSGPFGSLRSVRTAQPAVALTFDDGPDPLHTPRILDELGKFGAKATWFVLLDQAEANPALVRRILSEGHEIGLHGIDHRRLTQLPRGALREHIREGVSRLQALTGVPVRYFRPPYGAQNLATFIAARRLGLEVVVWSADCDDWSQHPPERIAGKAIAQATPGAVLLLHDTLAADPLDPMALPDLDRAMIVKFVLDGLGSRGLNSVSLGTLMGNGNAHRTMWFRS